MKYKQITEKLAALALRVRVALLGISNVSFVGAAVLLASSIVLTLGLAKAKSTPDFSEFEAGDDRKKAFFSFLLPLIEKQNAELVDLRKEVLELSDDRDQLSFFERAYARDLAERYKIENFSTEDSDAWDSLVRRVDVVPPSLALAQAANESAWGTSRFAIEGNNFYGHWCFVEGCGIVPAARDAGAIHEVADFDSAEESVEKYMHNLNRHPAYNELRELRAKLRKQEEPITGLKVISGLGSYSERGEEYIDELSAMIRYNDLDRHDPTQPLELL